MIRTGRSTSKGMLFAVLVLLCAPFGAAAQQIEWLPPAFEIRQPDGENFRYPEDLDGPTIVMFWASWCPYCKALMPHLQSILDEFPGQVDVLALTIREDGDPAELLAGQGYQFLLLENADEVAESWGVKGTPGLFLADGAGRVVFDRMRIPREDDRQYASDVTEDMSHGQRAARGAPYWAARLRIALDELLRH